MSCRQDSDHWATSIRRAVQTRRGVGALAALVTTLQSPTNLRAQIVTVPSFENQMREQGEILERFTDRLIRQQQIEAEQKRQLQAERRRKDLERRRQRYEEELKSIREMRAQQAEERAARETKERIDLERQRVALEAQRLAMLQRMEVERKQAAQSEDSSLWACSVAAPFHTTRRLFARMMLSGLNWRRTMNRRSFDCGSSARMGSTPSMVWSMDQPRNLAALPRNSVQRYAGTDTDFIEAGSISARGSTASTWTP